jgi:hypothetical protein
VKRRPPSTVYHPRETVSVATLIEWFTASTSSSHTVSPRSMRLCSLLARSVT